MSVKSKTITPVADDVSKLAKKHAIATPSLDGYKKHQQSHFTLQQTAKQVTSVSKLYCE